MNFRLRDSDATLKRFITMFLVVLTAGYGVGLFFVDHTTSLTSTGIQEQFLGNENGNNHEEIRYAKSANEMFIFMHNHIISLAFMFCIVGIIFYFSSEVTDRTRRFLILEPFAAIVTTFGGIALVRYVSPVFSWLVFLSGVSLFISYSAMALLILKELWLPKSRTR